MNRLMIESIEGRITLGIVMFVAIMILIGWVAINEPARMTSFTEQQQGRAIERGAQLFAANCSNCHGTNGQGSGLAPALNNPHFFGYDFMADVNGNIARLQREQQELLGIHGYAGIEERDGVIDELTKRRAELEDNLLALSESEAAGEAGNQILIELGHIDARLLDDAAAVEIRLAAVDFILLPQERAGLLDDFNKLDSAQQEGDTGRAITAEIGHIDARLLDDAAAVESRLAAIAAGEPLETDEGLEENQLTARVAALESNIPNILRAAGVTQGELLTEETTPALSEDELAARQIALETNIPNRLRAIELELNGDGTEANPGYFAQRETILASLGTARLNGYLPRLDVLNSQLENSEITPLMYTNSLVEDASRLSQVGWGGTLEGYILTTLIHGRPGSNIVWNGEGMAAWSQRGGGPLRDDEIRDIVAYILNWDKGENWTTTDLGSVNQFARLHTAFTGQPPEEPETALGPTECSANPDCVAGTGTVQEIAASLPAGDAINGSTLYATNACSGCHLGGALAPDLAGTWARIEGERLTLPEFEGWTAEEYVVTSILYPNHYVVAGYAAGLMPATFGQTLTVQDVADLVAYIREQ